jgi:adenosyl cobinamide kinase/adenosyl cobinamide phosphate guanylyltransferase
VILVIGGFASGKRDYVKKHYGFTDAEMADAVLDDRPVLYNLQDLVATYLPSFDSLLPALLAKKIVICNEWAAASSRGPNERSAREATGRLCVELAEKAEKVIRICCGLPSVIKE